MTPEGPTTASLTRVHKALIGTVATGVVIIAGIGFAGSYAAVRELALKKGFGDFSYWFPIGIDAGILVLLALDLLLTWIRIPFPLLRQTAWLLTVATIAFNGAAAWPDPLGVGMHAVIPVLFVVAVEAARHAIGRIADITADKHMEGVRVTRWVLSPLPTFLLWRRMKLWEVRSYEDAVRLEQERLVYQARLRARFGRGWRRKAPVEALMPLRLAKYGVSILETSPAGLEAAGIALPEQDQLDREAVDGEPHKELPTHYGRELEPGAGAVDQHSRDEGGSVEQGPAGDRSERHSTPLPHQHAPAPFRASETDDSAEEHNDGHDQHKPLAAASSPWAARNEGRTATVQARIDGTNSEWLQGAQEPFLDESNQSPFGDQPEPGVASELQLTGMELLEDRYLRLPAEERYPSRSASALARALHPGTGFTEGTARKYLKQIIDKHS